MDYETRPIGRKDLRSIAKWVRGIFKTKNKLRFNAINAFETIP